MKDSATVSVHRFRDGLHKSQRPDEVNFVLIRVLSKEITRHVLKTKNSLVAQAYISLRTLQNVSAIFLVLQEINLEIATSGLINLVRETETDPIRCIWPNCGE